MSSKDTFLQMNFPLRLAQAATWVFSYCRFDPWNFSEERDMYRFLCVLLAVFTPGLSWAQKSSGELGDTLYREIVISSYPKLDERLCEGPLRALIAAAINNEDTTLLEKRAHTLACLDGRSFVRRTIRDPDARPAPRGNGVLIPSAPVSRFEYREAHFIVMRDFFSGSAYRLSQALTKSLGMKLVLDLRDNPGGYLDELKDSLSLFAPAAGTPLYFVSSHRGVRVEVAAARGLLAGHSVAILVNRETASSAEVFAAALKFWGGRHTVVIGERTYKKGTVQNFLALAPPLVGTLTVGVITVGSANHSIPINDVGVSPDIYVPSRKKGETADPVYSAAMRYYGVFQ
jgi:hypothetical protein